jgi:hypothetical protein
VRRLASWRVAWRAVNIDPSPMSWNARSKLYEIREAGREPASAFYERLTNDYGSDLDLEAVIRESRKVHPGPEL